MVRAGLDAASIEESVLDGLPESVFGQDGWATATARSITRELLQAITSGRYGPFADAIRVAAHVPSARDVRAIANGVCDTASTLATISGQEYQGLVGRISELRQGANEIVDRLLEEAPNTAAPSATLTACETLLQVVAVSRPDLHRHLKAVSALSVRIGHQLDLVAEVLEATRIAALLHDIGLLTTGTDPALAERDPGHASLGEACLAGIEGIRHLALVVRAHHERFEGRGQPDGLRGAEIPIESRIIAVADAFEHLANRPGRTNPIAAAIGELWQDAGSAYDPDVVAAITRLFNQHWRVRRTASGAP